MIIELNKVVIFLRFSDFILSQILMNVVLREITVPEWDNSAVILSGRLNVCVKKSILRAVTLVN